MFLKSYLIKVVGRKNPLTKGRYSALEQFTAVNAVDLYLEERKKS